MQAGLRKMAAHALPDKLEIAGDLILVDHAEPALHLLTHDFPKFLSLLRGKRSFEDSMDGASSAWQFVWALDTEQTTKAKTMNRKPRMPMGSRRNSGEVNTGLGRRQPF